MNTKFKITTAILSAGLLITPISSVVQNNNNTAKANYNNKLTIEGKKLNNKELQNYKNSESYKLSQKIKNLLVKDTKTNKLKFNLNYIELAKELNITEKEASNLINILENSEPVSPYEERGFVGLYLNIGPYVKGLAPVVAGAFVAGYVGWYVKDLAKAGPWGAGAALAISGTISYSVGYAVSKGLSYTSVGIDIPFVSWSKTINLP